MAEILIVDDDRMVRKGIGALLISEGYEVREARNGTEALAAFAAKHPDLVLLDVMMPGLNGFRVCEEIRRTDELVPIVFLTAKDAETDRIRGIGAGADDYLSKDASEALVLACIDRSLRRAAKMAEIRVRQAEEAIALGGVTIDMRSMAVFEKGVEIARLTKSEVDILTILSSARNRLFTKDELVETLRGQGFACEDSMLYSHVYRLRRKLGSAGDLVFCARGAGYMLKG